MLAYDLILASAGKTTAVILHGLGDSKDGWKPVAPMLGLDGWGFCFVQAPDAYYDGFSWFDLGLEQGVRVDAAGVERSRRELVALLAHLESAQGLPCERLALIGFSQGCLMTLEVALRHPRPFLAVVAISGWLHREADWPAQFGAAARSQRILCTHGLDDTVVRIDLARPRIALLKRLGLDVQWAEYAKAHSLDPDEELGDIRRHLLDAAAHPPQPPAPGATA
jgi:phospholipase/carboxylesterase